MANAFESIANRAIGQYPISIATSLALESAFGHYPDRPVVTPPPILSVRNVWINIRTLIRNMHGSLDHEFRERVKAEDLFHGLAEELGMIERAIASQSQGYCVPVFYHCDYSRVFHRYSSAWLKLPKTPNQRHYSDLEDKTCKLLLGAALAQSIRRFNYELVPANGQFPQSYIITHLPIDLLSRHNFKSLILLESHTGALKGPAEWNTKLTDGKKHPNIPFSRFTMQVFGDNGNMFVAAPARLRDLVLEIAKRDQWTAVTTSDRIRFSISRIPNDIDRTTLQRLL